MQFDGIVQVLHSEEPRIIDPAVDADDLAAIVAGNNQFALDLYHTARKQHGNLFFSPYSISAALAMAYSGARGETARQIENVLHITRPPDQFHSAFNALDQALTRAEGRIPDEQREQAFQLTIANALWGQIGYHFEPTFLDTLARNYGAGLRLTDFAGQPESARLAVNAWVSDQTQQKIVDLIPQGAIDPLTRLVLVNAIYFKADWLSPFAKESTHQDTFTLLDSSVITTAMMAQTGRFRYAEGNDYQAVSLPYVGDAEMVVLVPRPGKFHTFEGELNGKQLAAIDAAMHTKHLNLLFPKFTFRSNLSLNETLMSLGMTEAFDPERADFSGMDGTRELFLSQAIHQAFVAVDEKGTEAAAATALTLGLTSAADREPPMLFKVDRPFLLLIRDGKTGTILFIGRVVAPR